MVLNGRHLIRKVKRSAGGFWESRDRGEGCAYRHRGCENPPTLIEVKEKGTYQISKPARAGHLEPLEGPYTFPFGRSQGTSAMLHESSSKMVPKISSMSSSESTTPGCDYQSPRNISRRLWIQKLRLTLGIFQHAFPISHKHR